ncbi:MAG: hypothetical protein JWR61_1928 [Ferruginibacter sp.]|nr:hypothetical protein [Ferruginibacter sp.]
MTKENYYITLLSYNNLMVSYMNYPIAASVVGVNASTRGPTGTSV